MIQRIQTIFLLFSLIASSLMFYTPILLVEGQAIDITDKAFQTLGILAGVIIFVTLITILLFKKRNLQIRLSIYNMILMLAFYGLFYYLYSSKLPEEADYSFKFAVVLPVISFILTFLAFRAIRRDEALIKSLDRLR